MTSRYKQPNGREISTAGTCAAHCFHDSQMFNVGVTHQMRDNVQCSTLQTEFLLNTGSLKDRANPVNTARTNPSIPCFQEPQTKTRHRWQFYITDSATREGPRGGWSPEGQDTASLVLSPSPPSRPIGLMPALPAPLPTEIKC